MAKLPFRPTPFFADKNKAFWRLQLHGWGGRGDPALDCEHRE
jgi:hypothetical protein